jgi:hypothetical protein
VRAFSHEDRETSLSLLKNVFVRRLSIIVNHTAVPFPTNISAHFPSRSLLSINHPNYNKILRNWGFRKKKKEVFEAPKKVHKFDRKAMQKNHDAKKAQQRNAHAYMQNPMHQNASTTGDRAGRLLDTHEKGLEKWELREQPSGYGPKWIDVSPTLLNRGGGLKRTQSPNQYLDEEDGGYVRNNFIQKDQRYAANKW